MSVVLFLSFKIPTKNLINWNRSNENINHITCTTLSEIEYYIDYKILDKRKVKNLIYEMR